MENNFSRYNYLDVSKQMYDGIERIVHWYPTSNRTEIQTEAIKILEMKHRRLVQFIGLVNNFQGRENQLGLVWEATTGTSLKDYLSLKKNIPERQRLWALQIAQGVAYLHSHGIVVQFLSGRNVIITNDLEPMLCDYAFHCLYGPSTITDVVFLAPEIVMKESHFTFESDIYSFGILLYEIFTDSVVSDVVLETDIDEKITDKLVQKCLSRDPSDRPTIAKVIDSLQQILVSSNTAQVPDLANPSSFDNFSTTCITLEDEPDLGTVYFNQGMAHLKEKEYKLGFQLIEKAANQGNVSALCKLGEMYELGCGVAKSIPWALLHYQKAAAGLCVTAYKHLGRIYFKGSDVKQDYEVALEWYLKAADEGDHKAQFIVGEMYEKGLGVQVDYMVSFEWHLKAILNGSQKSNWCLRQLLEKGFIKNIQETKVFEWFTKLAAEGNSVAQCELGIWYEKGLGVTQNSKSAFDYYAMAANANSANTLAVYKMNSFYEKGSFEPDSDSPLDLPKEDQVQGSSPLFMVGSAEDQNYVITKDMDDAPDWFKEASSDTANL